MKAGRFVIANADGEIVQMVETTDGNPPPMPRGMQAIPSEVTDLASHHVADGQLVAYTPDERRRRSMRPPHAAKWNTTTRRWDDLRTLDERKQAKWEEIKAARDAERARAVTTPHGAVQADTESRVALSLHLTALREIKPRVGGALPHVNWTMADNSVVALTADQLAGIVAQIAQRDAAAQDTANRLRLATSSATTAAAVDAVAWPATLDPIAAPAVVVGR